MIMETSKRKLVINEKALTAMNENEMENINGGSLWSDVKDVANMAWNWLGEQMTIHTY